jgi:hypothetical protein
MELKTGQRWQWYKTNSIETSHFVVEVIDAKTPKCRIIQLISSPNLQLGNERKWNPSIHEGWEYLKGQDKPE